MRGRGGDEADRSAKTEPRWGDGGAGGRGETQQDYRLIVSLCLLDGGDQLIQTAGVMTDPNNDGK